MENAIDSQLTRVCNYCFSRDPVVYAEYHMGYCRLRGGVLTESLEAFCMRIT